MGYLTGCWRTFHVIAKIMAIYCDKSLLRDTILDFYFASHQEICTELGLRLKRQRLAQGMTQKDLAERAGLAPGTVKNLEGKGVSSLESTIRIVMVLGLIDELAPLFELKAAPSIAQMERAQLAERKRAPRKAKLVRSTS